MIETLSLKTIKPSECKLAFSKLPPVKEILSVELKPLIETATPLATLKANVSESLSPEIIEMPVLFEMLKISFSISVLVRFIPPRTLNLPLPVTLLIEISSEPLPPSRVKAPPVTEILSTEIVSLEFAPSILNVPAETVAFLREIKLSLSPPLISKLPLPLTETFSTAIESLPALAQILKLPPLIETPSTEIESSPFSPEITNFSPLTETFCTEIVSLLSPPSI